MAPKDQAGWYQTVGYEMVLGVKRRPSILTNSKLSLLSPTTPSSQYLDENDPGAVMIPFSGALEQALLDEPENAKSYLEERKTTSALSKIITTGFKALGLQYFFTVGADEVS